MSETFRLKPLTLRGIAFDPPLFCAPMAGITHSAFRRLVAGFGGYGALFTEMLSGKMILHENIRESPWLKRRPEEGKVVYQLLLVDTGKLPEIIERLALCKPEGIDLNVACDAHTVRKQGGGSDLFYDPVRLREILRGMREQYPGPLFAKIRLGRNEEGWRGKLKDNLRMFEDEGVDAVTIHPRFYEEKFRRSAQHMIYAELALETRLPIIASGDIGGCDLLRDHANLFTGAAGLMIGRQAAARPWIFAQWHNPGLVVDHAVVWNRLCDYMVEDFPENKALMRIKIVAPYFARNFFFGHNFFSAVQSAPDLEAVRKRSAEFLASSPKLVQKVEIEGI